MKISAEIKKAILTKGIIIEELSDRQITIIKKNITQKYIQSQPAPFLWDRMKDAAVIADSDGWKKICDFIGNHECIMFFDDSTDKSMLVICDGKSLYSLLNEMFGFEFYITDFETNYLLCFNHHDCLLGCGTARKWIESLKK